MSQAENSTHPRVLIIGGYGVFGSRLSRRLAKHADITVIVAGRSLAAAKRHCEAFGGTPASIDAYGDLAEAFEEWQPTVVIDAAGPFQLYGDDPYRVVRAALTTGAHYIDLADDGAFVAGISELDRAAIEAGRVALSGCSSVPAVSAAAVRALSAGLISIESISSVILPGNRAPRGRSVVRAILAQVGKAIRVRSGGEWTTVKGWCAVHRTSLHVSEGKALIKRYASPIGAPDLQIFPSYFGARTVRFSAGLELIVMHRGLWLIAWCVRLGLMKSATLLTGPLLWTAERLKPFGSDRGGMIVDVTGREAESGGTQRRWTLIAEAGDGPEIPPTPAYLLALRLCQNTHRMPSGARPCLQDLRLADIEQGLAPFAISTEITSQPVTTVFETALDEEFSKLPPAIRDLHDVLDTRAFLGSARVERGKGLLSRLVGWSLGFPGATDNVPVRVDMKRSATGELWQRRFGSARFKSHLFRHPGAPTGEIWERFGALTFRIKLERQIGDLHFPVDAVRLFGLFPLPRILVPRSDTREYVDAHGNACFDVAITHPLAGFIVRYQGWLQPIEAAAMGDDTLVR
ncbi:MAG: DUF4166 domain-containing protein [Hyphomicrobiaceae bacterium]